MNFFQFFLSDFMGPKIFRYPIFYSIVTNSNPRVTSSNPRFASSNPQVQILELQVQICEFKKH